MLMELQVSVSYLTIGIFLLWVILLCRDCTYDLFKNVSFSKWVVTDRWLIEVGMVVVFWSKWQIYEGIYLLHGVGHRKNGHDSSMILWPIRKHMAYNRTYRHCPRNGEMNLNLVQTLYECSDKHRRNLDLRRCFHYTQCLHRYSLRCSRRLFLPWLRRFSIQRPCFYSFHTRLWDCVETHHIGIPTSIVGVLMFLLWLGCFSICRRGFESRFPSLFRVSISVVVSNVDLWRCFESPLFRISIDGVVSTLAGRLQRFVSTSFYKVS
jgi:hypothetical protein